jgi:hypothetical protein
MHVRGGSVSQVKWKPSVKEKGRIWLAFGLVFVALAVVEYLDTSDPSRSGRWSWIKRPFFEAFGDNGDVVLSLIAAMAAIIYGSVLLLRREEQ